MKQQTTNNSEIGIWYDVNDDNLYKKMTEKEIFEWLQTTNEFIWKSLNKEQQENRLNKKKEELYKIPTK